MPLPSQDFLLLPLDDGLVTLVSTPNLLTDIDETSVALCVIPNPPNILIGIFE